MEAAFNWLMLFIGSQVGMIGLGLLPLRLWKSFQDRDETNEPPGTSLKEKPVVT
jgi:hypothetical protein